MKTERPISELTKMERIRQGLEGHKERVMRYSFHSDTGHITVSPVAQISSETTGKSLAPIGLKPPRQQG
ncbi:hypothetical protein A2871_01865 [Candidatus Daviesbacteria bacterium RIFCSPHIGHO2_01_FULL_41_23]|uniref:Uncharacterized protein n=1 Tax=Candidatus Daviesbacteria bacterium RIFCSPHIGHO2_01_FULL_41_23 TaxID=1797764 RepID=A0A1F5IQZ7_9BACT|nr:MAG: hypothetical protein A2871_01865 [Candidatus Daviesbacteria bacterium RIFCSPHIGHO2_01_FULL_41_23]